MWRNHFTYGMPGVGGGGEEVAGQILPLVPASQHFNFPDADPDLMRIRILDTLKLINYEPNVETNIG